MMSKPLDLTGQRFGRLVVTERSTNSKSGLLLDPRRTTCFMSSGKYYVGGHFEKKGGTKLETDCL